jgi:hypothetical protein
VGDSSRLINNDGRWASLHGYGVELDARIGR